MNTGQKGSEGQRASRLVLGEVAQDKDKAVSGLKKHPSLTQQGMRSAGLRLPVHPRSTFREQDHRLSSGRLRGAVRRWPSPLAGGTQRKPTPCGESGSLPSLGLSQHGACGPASPPPSPSPPRPLGTVPEWQVFLTTSSPLVFSELGLEPRA